MEMQPSKLQATEAREARAKVPKRCEDDAVVPTPLRRRSVSPAVRSLGVADVRSEALPAETMAPRKELPHLPRGLGLAAGVAMLAFACFRPTWSKASMPSRQVRSMATVEPEPEEGPRLSILTREALECPSLKADILDVIAGAPYEFGTMEDQEALGNRCGRYALHRLAD
ncbi:unnamed protein product [Durusdinium trenchii]|uniref:Uncharacterized protein n=1 Tax=Durusdinium trenchii TaxID=1381693 RepID=A0ABP0QMS9_9DINO